MKIILNEKQIKSIALLEEQNKPVIPQACKAYYSDTEPTYYVDNQQNRNLNTWQPKFSVLELLEKCG